MTLEGFSDEDKRTVEGNYFKFEVVGDNVKGVFLGFEDGNFGEQIKLSNEEGEIIIGSYTGLKGKLKEEDIGKMVGIVFKDWKVSKNKRRYMEFEVFVKNT